jgi:hypothetical protein
MFDPPSGRSVGTIQSIPPHGFREARSPRQADCHFLFKFPTGRSGHGLLREVASAYDLNVNLKRPAADALKSGRGAYSSEI